MENIENQTSIKLVYDEQLIRELISDIIKNCSYRERISGTIIGRTLRSAENAIISATNFNGDPIYVNVCNFFELPDYVSEERSRYSYEADKLFSPQLVAFLINMINGDKVNYNWFINREEMKAKERAESKVKALDAEINNISNFQTQLKILKLQHLEKCVKELDFLAKFDYEKLSSYYDLAEQYIGVGLVQDTNGFQKKLTPSNK